MNSASLSRCFPPRRRQKAVALVIVLGFLVLLSGLVVAFFTSVSTGLTSANSYSAEVSTKQLADTATNLVTAQIADATRGYQDGKPASLLAWACQPGMMRTFDQNGNPYKYYKLYSAANMVLANIPSGYNVVTSDFEPDTPTDWSSQVGVFTDLNAPALVPDATGSIVKGGIPYRADYPILDPSALAATGSTNGVEGFSINNRLGAGNPADPTGGPANNPAPMPCRWLYVLKDGTLISPSQAIDGHVTFQNSTIQPTIANSIVGRVAFWTDDESAKVNLNTSSEGTFWDQPRTPKEVSFGDDMPAQNEFQRFSGHPAMTCLSTVFGFLGGPWHMPGNLNTYLTLAPRVNVGGSNGGTTAPVPITPDNDRLFASIDELAYNVHYQAGGAAPQRTLNRTLDPSQSGNQSLLIRAQLEKVKFFITTSSRAPETTLFNTPRVCLWPLMANESNLADPANAPYRNIKDRLIAFCTSTGSGSMTTGTYHPYYFQRYSPYSTNGGYSGDGRTSYATPTPSSQSTWEDFSLTASQGSIGTTNASSPSGRNIALYQYLQSLTSQMIPGFGGSFVNKYDSGGYSDRNQILTEMYDMIRTGVNTYNTALQPLYDFAPTRQGGPVAGETQLVPTFIRAQGNTASGYFNTTAADPSVTKGFGRFMTVPEIAVVFYNTGLLPAVNGQQPPKNINLIKAAIVMDQFNSTPGMASWSPHVRYAITGLNGFQINGQPLGLPDKGTNGTAIPFNFLTARVGYVEGGHTTSMMGLLTEFHYFSSGDVAKKVGNDGSEATYPFVSQIATGTNPVGAAIDISQGSMKFSGGPLQIQIFAGYENLPDNKTMPTQLVQTINVIFPPIPNCPVPSITGAPDFNGRMAGGNLIDGGADVVRSMQVPSDSPNSGATGGASTANAAQGDLRILAGLAVVPTQMYTPHPYYFNTGQKMAHSLRNGGPNYLAGAQTIKSVQLVPGENWSPEPVAARGQSAARNVAGIGDFDNAMGGTEDGCYTNKPDEGNSATGGGYFQRGFFNVENGATFSPNRQISSAVAFGSLPSGLKATERALYNGGLSGKPWQTLLFCPNPAAGQNHPGFGISKNGARGPSHTAPFSYPPDHLLLDLFTMPIVEPYAISEPFSTAGKVNLNYQLAPFTHITRSTGIRAVMKSTQVLAIPTSSADKSAGVRYNIAMDTTGGNQGTLTGFESLFSAGEIFRCASQICDIFLVPAGTSASYSSMASWWNGYLHTGDNSREYPYGHIYPRVTTKSNVFTVHMRVQTLRKAKSADPNAATYWDETRDKVVGEYRGSNTIERYIDASDTTLPDYAFLATTPPPPPLDQFYRFRTVSSKRFSP